MSGAVATNRRAGRTSDNDDSVRAEFAEVNLDAKDMSEAIERRQEPALLLSKDDDDSSVSDPAPKSGDSREWRKRVSRINRRFSQQNADMEARHQREMRNMRDEIDALRARREAPANTGAQDQVAHDAHISALTVQLEAAIEAGNTKEQVRLQTLITRTDNQFWAKQRGAEASQQNDEREKEEQRRTRARQAAEAASAANNGGGKVSKEGQRWARANEDWFDDDEFAVERDAAIRYDNDLLLEGSDPESQEHYVELVRRLKKKFPALETSMPRGYEDLESEEDEDERPPARRAREDDELEDAPRKKAGRKPPVPGFRNGLEQQQPQRRVAGRRVVLTADDRANMIRFKLDPTNDADVRAYAEGKAETAQAYGDRG